MSSQRHIIGRTVLELDSGALADVWELQETMSRLLQHQAMGELEPLFDQLAGEEEVIRLDQVEIDLGAIAPHALEEEFVPALVKALGEALSDRLIQDQIQRQIYAQAPNEVDLVRHSHARSDWEVFLFFLQYGRLPWWQMETNWQAWLGRWRSVMKTTSTWQGPLFSLLDSHPVTQRRLLFQVPKSFLYQLIRQSRSRGSRYAAVLAQAQKLAQGLRLSPRVQTRLDEYALQLIMQQLNPDQAPPLSPAGWIRQWLTEVAAIRSQSSSSTPTPTQASSSVQQVYQRLREALGTMGQAERSLWDTAMEDTVASPAQPNASIDTDAGGERSQQETAVDDPTLRRSQDINLDDAAKQSVLRTGEPTPRHSGQEPRSSANDQRTSTSSTGSDTSPFQSKEPNAQPSSDMSAHSHDPMPQPPGLSPKSNGSQKTSSRASNAASNAAKGEERETLDTRREGRDRTHLSNPRAFGVSNSLAPEEETSGIYIQQAGLVLLHPFLANYLRGVGLVEDDAFLDEIAQQTAIYLLHYLTTRQTSAPEYELVLPKLLCGWPLNEALTSDIALPDATLEEGEQLLQTVIDYWEALKSTSPDGLRDGFLQRDGKLTRTGDQSWKLQVEQMSIDVLLSRLPWGVSIVKLPWMDELLSVEWT